jgi:hypothetical protein
MNVLSSWSAKFRPEHWRGPLENTTAQSCQAEWQEDVRAYVRHPSAELFIFPFWSNQRSGRNV